MCKSTLLTEMEVSIKIVCTDEIDLLSENGKKGRYRILAIGDSRTIHVDTHFIVTTRRTDNSHVCHQFSKL